MNDQKAILKRYYEANKNASLLSVPGFTYICLKGQGDPNKEDFALAMAAIYSLAYAIKMSDKGQERVPGYYPYKVYPLMGEWSLVDPSRGSEDKDNYAYTLFLQQPPFVTSEVFNRFLLKVKAKKANPMLDQLYYYQDKEYLYAQALHVGPYEKEKETFKIMDDFCLEQGYRRIKKEHIEVYLSDPRRVEGDKLKTILRYRVDKIESSQ